MKTPSAALLLCVCELLLSALTVSAVSVSVSPDLQQFFSGSSSSVSLSCVDDGQTADGWTVRRSRGGLTEDCGAAAGFGRIDGSFCVLSRSVSSDGRYSCVNSSGQQSDEVSISVSEKGVILEIPALPVRTGSDVTLRCRERSSDTAAAFFKFNGSRVGSGTTAEHVIKQASQSDEGFYSCATDKSGSSPQSFLRVRDPPPSQEPTDSTPPVSSPFTAALSPPLPPSSATLLRLLCHLLVVCPYCICTVLLVLICSSGKSAANSGAHTGKTPAVSMETAQHTEEHDGVTADVTAEHDFEPSDPLRDVSKPVTSAESRL